MFSPRDYQLLDFGKGRKLERIGGYLIDRPAHGTEGMATRLPDFRWRKAAARYDRTGSRRHGSERGCWTIDDSLPDSWRIGHNGLQMVVRPTQFGQLGLFPEQAENWDWLASQLCRSLPAARVLNLFGYTGGSTLAAAAAGAEVAHVDSAKNILKWARENATASGLGGAPIRWIHEDAQRFVERELRRGNRYDGVILDPPTYGHGPKGRVWKIDRHLARLVDDCIRLGRGELKFLLLTCHSTGLGPDQLRAMLRGSLDSLSHASPVIGSLVIRSLDGRELASGVFLRAKWGDRLGGPPHQEVCANPAN